MEFSPEVLRAQAQRLTDRLVKDNSGILAVYLRGSLLYGSPLIGGAGDIDLVLIYHQPPELDREILPLTPEIHFDLAHHDQLTYHDPRRLRATTWLGPTLRDAQPLHDPKHFIDYTQSSVRGRYDSPETVQARAHPILEEARQFWLDRQLAPPLGTLGEIQPFLSAVEKTVNALALLDGPPLPTRRLGASFPAVAHRHDPELLPAFYQTLGGHHLEVIDLQNWLKPWSEALSAGQGTILAQQKTYFRDAVDFLLEGEQPLSALWPLLSTWTDACRHLPADHPGRQTWREACGKLGLAGNDYPHRLSSLDHFLELTEACFQRRFRDQDWG